jgi:hypothetical protein
MISVKPILLLRVSNNDLFLLFFLARTSNVCVANAMFVFRFVSKFFEISFSVNFCKKNKFCQISLAVVSYLLLFSVEFLLTAILFPYELQLLSIFVIWATMSI